MIRSFEFKLTNRFPLDNHFQLFKGKTKVLFSLVKKYIKGRLSLVDVVNYLEPYMIYPIDLTYMQFREINSFIYEKIKEYNLKFKECSMAFSSLRYTKQIGRKPSTTKNATKKTTTTKPQGRKPQL